MGHTHEDIDQAFSRTSQRLKSNNAITLSDFHAELRTLYNKYTTVESISIIIDWSDLCEKELCLTDMQRFTKFFHFLFYIHSYVQAADNTVRCAG